MDKTVLLHLQAMRDIIEELHGLVQSMESVTSQPPKWVYKDDSEVGHQNWVYSLEVFRDALIALGGHYAETGRWMNCQIEQLEAELRQSHEKASETVEPEPPEE